MDDVGDDSEIIRNQLWLVVDSTTVVWVVVWNIFGNFHPENWGNDSQFDEHIFQRGWFNHQLAKVVFVHSRWCRISEGLTVWNRGDAEELTVRSAFSLRGSQSQTTKKKVPPGFAICWFPFYGLRSLQMNTPWIEQDGKKNVTSNTFIVCMFKARNGIWTYHSFNQDLLGPTKPGKWSVLGRYALQFRDSLDGQFLDKYMRNALGGIWEGLGFHHWRTCIDDIAGNFAQCIYSSLAQVVELEHLYNSILSYFECGYTAHRSRLFQRNIMHIYRFYHT